MSDGTKKNVSSKERAYDDLRFRIITQELPPGELLKEKELMEHYGIGRTPLREILIELHRQGLIRRVPRAGTWVAPLDLDFVKEIAEVRVPLERMAGKLAAERITAEELQRLEDLLAKAESIRATREAPLSDLIQTESRFHHVVYAAARNGKLQELLLEFQSITSRLWHRILFTREHLARMFDDQRKMLKLLKEGRGEECGQLMAEHTQAYFNHLNQINGKQE